MLAPRAPFHLPEDSFDKGLFAFAHLLHNIKPLTDIKMVTSVGPSSFFNFPSGCLQHSASQRRTAAESNSKWPVSPRLSSSNFRHSA
jgi:hypothetical protein